MSTLSTFDTGTVRNSSITGANEKVCDDSHLARLICLHAPCDGVVTTRISGLKLGRFSLADGEQVKTFYEPSLGMVVQGTKSAIVGRATYSIEPRCLFVLPVAVPLSLQTIKASFAEPLLIIRLDLDPQVVAETVLKVFPHGLPVNSVHNPAYTTRADDHVVDAFRRLMECLNHRGDDALLAPLVMQEILIRLLQGPIGPRIAELGLADSVVNRVARSVNWLQQNFAEPMKVEALAGLVFMSPSTFYEQFRAVTGLSPLQYQKALRLQESRRLMLAQNLDAATAARQVGYASESQFSRDYSRYYGSPPRRDIALLRQSAEISG